jgi:hypothetical protein
MFDSQLALLESEQGPVLFQALYHLSHARSPFCFSCLFNRLSSFCSGQPGPGCSHRWDHVPPLLAYWLRWSVSNFLPRLPLNCSLPHHYLLSSWDYRCVPSYSATFDSWLVLGLTLQQWIGRENKSNIHSLCWTLWTFLLTLRGFHNQIAGKMVPGFWSKTLRLQVWSSFCHIRQPF